MTGRLAKTGKRIRRIVAALRPTRPGPMRDAKVLIAVGGGGPLWQTAGRRLFAEDAAFRAGIVAAEERVQAALGLSPVMAFREGIRPDDWAQARAASVLYMGMTSLGMWDALARRGVAPAGVLGISLGEIISAHIAGAITREQALDIMCAVVRRVFHSDEDCLILQVRAGAGVAGALCRHAPAPLAVMGEAALGVSMLQCLESDEDAIRRHLARYELLETRAAKARYHVLGLPFDRTGFEADLADVRAGPLMIPLYSCAYGGQANAPLNADYWRRVVTVPHFFGEAFANALADGIDVAIEVGSPTIEGWMRETAQAVRRNIRIVDRLDWHPEAGRVPDMAIPRATTVASPPPPASGVALSPDRGAWLVTGHAAARTVLTDPVLFSSAPYRGLDPALLGSDPPAHAPVRAALAREMGPGMLERILKRAIAVAEAHVEPALDAVSGFAAPVAQAAAAEFVGFDQAALREIVLGECALEAAKRPFAEHVALVGERVAGTRLYRALVAGGLDAAAAHSVTRLIWFAAAATSERAIARSVQVLVQEPGLQDRIAGDPAARVRLFEEVLRLYLPAPILERVATAPCILAGNPVAPGDRVQIDLAAVNRDPGLFEDPDRVRLDRDQRMNLTFGTGAHACIGAAVARRVVPAAVGVLTSNCRLVGVQAFGSRWFAPDPARGPVRLFVEREAAAA